MRRVVLTIAALVVPSHAIAQNPIADAPRGYRPVCWQPRSGASCGSFPVTEFKALARILPDVHGALATEMGWMFNMGERHAVGVTGYFMVDFEEAWGGALTRYRHWISPTQNVGLGVGLRIGANEYERRPGPMASIEWNPSPLFGVVTRFESRQWLELVSCVHAVDFRYGAACTERQHNDVEWYIGAHTGAQPGFVASLVGGATLLTWVLIILSHAT